MEISMPIVVAGSLVVCGLGVTALFLSLVTVVVGVVRAPAESQRGAPLLLWGLLALHVVSMFGLWPLIFLAAVPSLGIAALYGLRGDPELRLAWGGIAAATLSWLGMFLGLLVVVLVSQRVSL